MLICAVDVLDVRKLSSCSGEMENSASNNHSNDKSHMHLAGTEGLINTEQTIRIVRYGSIVGGDEISDKVVWSDASTMAEKGAQDSIKTESPINIKMEMAEGSGAEMPEIETPMDLKTEVLNDYGEGTIKMEDTTDVKTENRVTGNLKEDTTNIGTGSIHVPQICRDENAIKTDIEAQTFPTTKQNISALNDPNPTCRVCRKSFYSEHYLKKYEILHTGETPYQCNVCRKSFVNEHFTIHSLLHTGEKPYSCAMCGQSFAQKGTLTKHTSRWHTKETSASCTVCGKSFPHKSGLNE